MQPEINFVFDVESIGLHGDGFAVGWCVVDEHGRELDAGFESINPSCATGSDSNRLWVAENVLPHLPPQTVFPAHREDPRKCTDLQKSLRSRFWVNWITWNKRGAKLWAECAWPVEARFLAACVDDDLEARRWQGPYPLHEIATVLDRAGMDPMKEYERTGNQNPKHHPTADARQSAYLLTLATGALHSLREKSRPQMWVQNDLGEFSIEGKHCKVTLFPCPTYSDRGDYMAMVDVHDRTKLVVDAPDGFPRYFFGLDVAMSQCERWLHKRNEYK